MKRALGHADDVMETVSLDPMSALPSAGHLDEEQAHAEVRGAIFGSPEVTQKLTEFFSKLRGIRYEANVSMIALRRKQDATESLRRMHAYRDEASDVCAVRSVQSLRGNRLEFVAGCCDTRLVCSTEGGGTA